MCQPTRDINSHRITPEESAQAAIWHLKYEKGEQFTEFARKFVEDLNSGVNTIHNPQGLTCRAGDTCCWIDFRGMMLPCDIMEDYGVSLKEQTVEEAWKKVREVRQSVEPYDDCMGCKLKTSCNVCWAIARMEKRVNGNLDYLCRMAEEKKSTVTSNNSKHTEGFNGIRKAWIYPDLTEVEVGAMQHSGQWTAYTPGSLKRNFSLKRILEKAEMPCNWICLPKVFLLTFGGHIIVREDF